VVAADDGVMPQTVEAINHAQAGRRADCGGGQQIDKEGADPAKIRGQLTEYGLVAEDFGGDTMFVDISAKQGTTSRHWKKRCVDRRTPRWTCGPTPTWRPRVWR